MTGLQTEFTFRLPKGFVDAAGTLHRDGLMRLATARDEIEPLRDPRIAGPDDPYLTIAILGRVITRLGAITDVGPEHIEALFAADLAHLQELYGVANFGEAEQIQALQAQTAARLAEDAALAASEPGPGTDTSADDAEASDSGPPAPPARPRVRSRIEEVPARSDA
ncbi:MAG: hypothetical protein L7U56_00995 [Acidimicrobiales bacterium]|nr:hypothetical protein [Acidimicrobiales bacterium]